MTLGADQVRRILGWVDRAGELLVEGQATAPMGTKADGTYVSPLDLRVQEFLLGRVVDLLPGLRILAEETQAGGQGALAQGATLATAGPVLIVDPVDGSREFGQQQRIYGICLSLTDSRSETVLAVIHQPALGRTYVAWRGNGGVTLNGHPLAPGPWPRRLADAYLCVSSDLHRCGLDITDFPGKIRAAGPTSWALTQVLARQGGCLAALVTRGQIWDLAAGAALAEALGLGLYQVLRGRRTSSRELIEAALAGHPLAPCLVAAPRIAERLLPMIRLSAMGAGAGGSGAAGVGQGERGTRWVR